MTPGLLCQQRRRRQLTFQTVSHQNYCLLINNNVTRKAATQFNNASVSRVPPVREVERTDSRLNEGPTTTTLPWHSRALSPFTLYSELSTARTPEQYASVHSRLRQEWLFIGGFVGRFTTAS